MLQHPVHFPHQDNDSPIAPVRRRFHKHSSSLTIHRPLSVSTNLPHIQSHSPSPISAKFPRSPYISTRQLPTASPLPFNNNRPLSASSISSAGSTIDDVLVPGDIVGEGFYLQGEVIREVQSLPQQQGHPDLKPANELEVIKQLGTGSYAVVYLVQEVLARPALSDDGHMSTIGQMEGYNTTGPQQVQYGRKYAVKCLSKANLDEEALAVQMSEVCCIRACFNIM
jgi:hypothetical protein